MGASDVERYAVLIHPSVDVPESCTVGAGSIVLAGCVLTADVRVGRHVVMMPGVVLTHDDVIEEFDLAQFDVDSERDGVTGVAESAGVDLGFVTRGRFQPACMHVGRQ